MFKSLAGSFLFVSLALALAGCRCGAPGTPVLAIPLDDDSGFALAGVHDFEGVLKKPVEDGAPWTLDWKFTFPTGGFAVDDIEVQVAESFPEQVSIRFLVDTPEPWEVVTQAIVEVDGDLEIAVDAAASFDIRIVELCNLDLPQ